MYLDLEKACTVPWLADVVELMADATRRIKDMMERRSMM